MTGLLVSRMLGLLGRWHVLRTASLALAYAGVIALSLWVAYQLRFDFDVPPRFSANFVSIFAMGVGIKLLLMVCFQQFAGLLTYFSLPDLKRLVAAGALAALLLAVVTLTMGVEVAPPRGVILIDFMFCVAALSGLRLSFGRVRRAAHAKHRRQKPRHVGIIGAGDAGASLARDLLAKPWLGLRPVAFFDDYRGDRYGRVHGIPVVGRPERIGEFKAALSLEELMVAMPSAPARRIREIVLLARGFGLPCRTLPGLDALVAGRISVATHRPVQLQDLLGREPVEIDGKMVGGILEGQTVMVTGAGGSIGSELCRQILSFNPKVLLLVERSEPQLFLIEQELQAALNAWAVVPLVGDITQPGRMREIFRRYHPQIIFHAAAHKHVPMMEAQPGEAIRNNIFGTAELADLALEYAVERFVFVSTDKAVNPTSVMGATKRFAEIYLQSLNLRGPATKFMAVRFGNVLGSSGSVVPTFTRQIAAGDPVTITHAEMTRFFMTIPEAATLVLQSAAIGEGGSIFILDMGKPVKILNLALRMIELSGLRPHEDIEVVFTGLRPGEKLHEELSHQCENVTPTEHPKIMRLTSPTQNYGNVRLYLDELAFGTLNGNMEKAELKRLLFKTISACTPDKTGNAAEPHFESQNISAPSVTAMKASLCSKLTM